MKTIFVDIGLITKKKRGMGIYILNIIRNINPSLVNQKLIFIYNRNNDFQEIEKLRKQFERYKHIQFKGSPFGPIITEQLVLPFLLQLKPKSLLICNGDSAPLMVKPQKLILLLHDLYFFTGKELYRKNKIPLRKRIGINYRRLCIGRFREKKDMKVITVSLLLKKQISDFKITDNSNICVIPNGVDLNNINNYNKENKKNQIVLVTGPDPQKNFNRFFVAINSIKKDSISDVEKIIVIGMKKPDNLCYTDITFCYLGYQEHNMIIKTLCESKYFIIPSLFESFGIPAIEALAANCKIASSNTGALPEVLGDNAIYFDPLDIQSISNAIEKLISDIIPEQSKTNKGLEEFDWENISLHKFIPFVNNL